MTHSPPTNVSPSPARATVRWRVTVAGLTVATLIGAALVVASSARAAAPPTPAGWTQTFLDDFTGTSLNTGNWQVSEGTSYPGGPSNFGTGEIEVSSRNNVSVSNGVMSITALGQGAGAGWTAARIETNRTDFQPAGDGKVRFEAVLRLPAAPNGQSNGYWPAFWILAATYRGNWWNWPTVGEIDIMENVSGLNRTWQTMHCGWLDPLQGPNICNEKDGIGNGGMVNGQINSCTPSCTTSFHTYTMDWSRADQSATWWVDGRQVHRLQRGVNVPANAWDLATARGFYVILNIAMGGEMPFNNGVPINGATTGGGHFDADYVAVYNGPVNAPPPAVGLPGTGTPPTTTPPPAQCGPLLSQGRPASSSATEGATYAASNAVDGNPATRWSSAFSDPQWIQVDLGSAQPISRVHLDWEAAYGSGYTIQTSTDGTTWTTAHTESAGNGGADDLAVTANARYVRVNGTSRGTPYGYSLWEFQVFGACAS